MVVGADGSVQESDIYKARVRNHSKLAYNRVAAWLEGNGDEPEAMAAVNGLDENLRIQDKAAQSMKNLRHFHGRLVWKLLKQDRYLTEMKSVISKWKKRTAPRILLRIS